MGESGADEEMWCGMSVCQGLQSRWGDMERFEKSTAGKGVCHRVRSLGRWGNLEQIHRQMQVGQYGSD